MRSLVMLTLAAAFVMVTGAGAARAQAGAGGAAPSQVSAETGDPDAVLAQLRESVNFARYAEALDAAHRLLQRGDLVAHQRNAALEAIATVQIATNAEGEARATLDELYRRDPQHRISDPDASPPVQSAFARARDAHPTLTSVRLEQAPLDLRQRQALEVAIRISVGADAVEELRLAYRQAGETRYTRVVMALDHGVARARLPLGGDLSQPATIDYFVEAIAPSLAPLARVGSEAQPLVVEVPAARAPGPAEVAHAATDDGQEHPWASGVGGGTTPTGPSDSGGSVTSSWWFWTLIGVVVVGGTVGTYAALSSGGAPVSGTLGAITLN